MEESTYAFVLWDNQRSISCFPRPRPSVSGMLSTDIQHYLHSHWLLSLDTRRGGPVMRTSHPLRIVVPLLPPTTTALLWRSQISANILPREIHAPIRCFRTLWQALWASHRQLVLKQLFRVYMAAARSSWNWLADWRRRRQMQISWWTCLPLPMFWRRLRWRWPLGRSLKAKMHVPFFRNLNHFLVFLANDLYHRPLSSGVASRFSSAIERRKRSKRLSRSIGRTCEILSQTKTAWKSLNGW